MKKVKEYLTFYDRLMISLISGVTAFSTSVFAWLLVIYIDLPILPVDYVPFSIVIWFSVVMAIFGFLLLDNIVLNILSKIWKVTSKVAYWVYHWRL